MSGIKSDKWIREQCIVPDIWVTSGNSGRLLKVAGCFGENDARILSQNYGSEVRRPTLEELSEHFGFTPMIEPFEPNQKRFIERPLTADELFRYHNGEGDTLSGSVVDDECLVPNTLRQKIISYGTSSYGYDIRCAPEFKVFTNVHSTVVDPKRFDEKSFWDMEGDSCVIPPNSFALARSVEFFRIPRDVLVVCLGKSTYARCGIIVNVTPLEPEWEGHITLEFSNTTPLPARIYANEGCAQLLFFQCDQDDVCETSYRDRGGKYQGQLGVTLPKA